MKKMVAVLACAALMSIVPGVVSETVGINKESICFAEMTNGDKITAQGFGFMRAGMPMGQAKLMARRAAIVDAQRNLVSEIKGTVVDAETTMENYVITSDVVKTKVSGMVTGAKIVSEKFEADGSYSVIMEVPAYGVGSVADVAINAVVGNQPQVPVAAPAPSFAQNYQPVAGSGYTGVVIDAKNSGLVRTYCPAIYDTNGRAIYGVHNVDKDYAIQNGVAEYASGSARWAEVGNGGSRAGANPLYIKIVSLRPRIVNKCDVIISVEDADKLLAENQRSNFMGRYAVVMEM